MKTLEELQVLILEWAKEKDLLHIENAPKQRLKLLEEVGETASAILKNKPDEIKDGIGDIFVVLVILAEQTKEYIDFYFCVKSKKESLFRLLYSGNNDDCFSALFNLNDTALSLNLNLTECANLAWNEIKDRKGKTENGTFIREK